jgi:hypothetical protein
MHALSELLQRHPLVLSRLGDYFHSRLLQKDAADSVFNEYQHLEYSPLLNARAHTLRTAGGAQAGGSSDSSNKSLTIQNKQFAEQYQRLLRYLTHRISGRERLTAQHKLALTYYFLLQERIQEAKAMFEEVLALGDGLPCGLQVDYLRCYFDFYSPVPSVALAIAQKYAAHPVSKKRKLFAEVEKQLMEVGAVVDPRELEDEHSQAPSVADRDAQDRDREMSNRSSAEPFLDFDFSSRTSIEVRWANVSSAQFNFYVVDVEQLFSQEPFSIAQGGRGAEGGKASKSFLFVAPNASVQVPIPSAQPGSLPPQRMAPISVSIPAEFQQKNCWVELSSGGAAAGIASLSIVKPLFSHHLSVQLTPSYGQVKVLHAETGRPLLAM